MPEERGAVSEDRIEIRLDRIEQRMIRLEGLPEDVAELKGAFSQMDKRLSNVERAVSQILWGMISGFLVTIVAILLTKLL